MPSALIVSLAAALALAACAQPGAAPAESPPPAPSAVKAPAVQRAAPAEAAVVDEAPPPAAPLPAAPPPAAVPAAPDTTERVRTPLPDGFARLSDAAPAIAQEIRYTTPFNFVGAPIDGYLAPECILTTRAAEALRFVAADLAERGLGLKVYDCYRPQQAVDHFVRWIRRPDDQAMKTAFYPAEPKLRLVRNGYISTRSGHSRGSTVDLTLVELPVAESILTDYPAFDQAPRCDRPAGERLHERDLDMGTAYDCLSPLAATATTRVSAAAQRNRRTLTSAMSRRGFRNYSKEWWHFTLRGEPESRHYNFPVD